LYFKGMQLQGFKSFADKTNLDFKGGITAVVGPNGSGKSNISDAIRWVMGEMSAKSLRGSKMEDIIFCGSETRKPLGFAEVTIIMDNSDHSMNIDFEEISVTRRVYRSGESEYLINKAPCRLKDIHELFMDTGLGRDGYSIIGQGKIDAILSAKSEERRHIFDEAAGITKYRYRKNEAEKKLSDTQENLIRVGDIIAELEGQVEPLRIQSEKAREFLKLRDLQKDLEVNTWLYNIEYCKSSLDEVVKAHNIVKEHISKVEQDISDTETEINKIREQIKETDGNTDRTRAEMYEKRDEITKTEGEIELIKSSASYAEQNIFRLDGEITQHKTRCEALSQLTKSRVTELEELISSLDIYNIQADEIKLEIQDISEKLRSFQETFESGNDEISDINDELFEYGAKIAANKQLILSSSDRESQLENMISEQNIKFSEMQKQIDELNKETGDLAEKTLKQQEITDNCKAYLEATDKSFGMLKTKLLNSENEYKSQLNRKKILEDLENDFEGYSKSIKSVMNEYKFGCLKNAEIYGPVSTLIKTSGKYVTAIEAAVGGSMNNIVTGSEDDAKLAINYLKKNNKGRVTFMPVSAVKGKAFQQQGAENCAGFIGVGTSLINFDSKFKGIMDYLLGRTVIVDNLDNGIAMAKKYGYSFKIATLQGDILNAGGSITGGSVSQTGGGLSRLSEIKELTVRLAVMEEEIKSANPKINALQKELETAKNKFAAAQQTLWEHKRTFAEYTTSSKHIIAAYEDMKININSLNDELESLRRKKESAILLEKEINSRRELLTKRQNEITSANSDAADTISALQEAHFSLIQKQNEITIEQNNISKDIEIARTRLDEAKAELAENQNSIESKALEQKKLKQEKQQGVIDVQNNTEKAEKLKAELVTYEEKLKAFEDLRAGVSALQDKAEAALKEHNSAAFKLQGEEGRIEAKRVKLEGDVENIIAKLWDEYELTYTAASEFKKENFDINSAGKELASVKNKIKALGNINLNAIEDYKTTKERYEFLSTQQKDILAAKAELETLIEEMTKIMTEMFEKNFARLNEKFEETFRSLFGGGKASLMLSSPDDVLESGVEIVVQPPGKNLQNITLLSGGEKAFTAIALIFSILKINPTHFCIFDEIEAALDDVNVFRFADFLKALSKRTQFIVITHRKGTMEAADTLYGVTMQEKGVTSLLSLDLERKE